VKGWEKLYQANKRGKQAGVLMLITDEADSTQKLVKKDFIKDTIH
jgi:hypothetical protein